jgi:protein transport protein SEC61 subunit alpha
MPGRFLSLFKPIGRVLPEIKKPERKVSFNEKIFWTALVLVIFLVMTEIPLYGVAQSASDQFGQLRVIFASNRGTLMELGIGPIVTAGLILQLLAGSSIIKCDMSNHEDRGLFTSASKVFTIVLTGIQAGAYILSGMYGPSLSGPVILVIFAQLIITGLIVMLMDELVQKGWGLGSGISLFIMAGVAQTILWSTFSPPTGLFVGSLSYLGGQQTLGEWAFGSAGGVYPSLLGLIATISVFLIVIYLQGIRIELPMSYAGYKGFRSRYPIKLLYVSNLPVIFASALFANVYFFSQLIWSQFGRPAPGTNILFQIIGDYSYNATSGSTTPVGGLAYFVTPPRNIQGVIEAPLQASVYLVIIIAFCAIFSLIWLEVGGLGPAKVAKQLMDSGMQIPGYRRSGRPIEAILKRYIPAVTVLGGIIVGLVAGVSDFLGAFGSGTGILLSVGIIYQYYELLMRERAAEMFPAFRRILGE